jgi:hypothetical protein
VQKKTVLSVARDEPYELDQFSIIRLAGSGAGAAEPGEVYKLECRAVAVARQVKVIASRDKLLGDLDDEDAGSLGQPLPDLRAHLYNMYRFRPQWDGDRTLLRIVELRALD